MTKPRAVPPVDLAIIKDDLNIPATDTSNDAWLNRRIAEIWARMEVFTSRKLVSPPADFVDDWGEVLINGAHVNLPPTIAYWPRSTVFLRVYPVIAIKAVELSGSDLASISDVKWDIDSGKLLGLDPSIAPGAWFERGLDRHLLYSRARVTYTAGWDTIPADLYAALLGVLTPLWQARQAQQGGFGGGAVTQVDVMDVGSVQLASANAFVEATLKGVRTTDPLLGPWAANLTDYIDWRATLGVDCFPTTKTAPGNGASPMAIGDVPPANPAVGESWWNSAEGREYVYYDDGSSRSWVQADIAG
jgi:hypothetical protein